MNRTLSISAILGILLVGLIVSVARAHPHVFVDASLKFSVADGKLESVRQHWLFDEFFTKAILADIGLPIAAVATPEGQAAVKSGAFDYLRNYSYFTFVENAGKRTPVTRIRDFAASLEEGRLVYDFTVPLDIPLKNLRNFRFAVFDSEYYTDILLLKDNIVFESDGSAGVSHAIRLAKDQTYWGYVVPEAVCLSANAAGAGMPSPVPAVQAGGTANPVQRVMAWVLYFQKELKKQLNEFGSGIQGNPFGASFWLFLGLSFVYGVVHAVGPGHGKTVVCSYFLSRPGSLAAGAVMGNAITFVHMSSAAVAVGAAYLLFSSSMGGFQQASRALQPASFGLIALMGLYLAFQAVCELRRGGLVSGKCTVDHDLAGRAPDMKHILTVSFVTGLVPCPGAAVILAFAIGQNIFWAGLAAIVCMALGMGMTTTLFAWLAVGARGLTLRMTGRNRKAFNWAYGSLSVCGALFIALFGAALFLTSI
ncbi:DUF1007 family protein [Pseudodesulfovibrio tunisiensis]|uniref:HoxN/HupN/NixA family nickel/cobalt transporter n=1 Tax=Pseudodesulfovibrio tunisiensis TaxID=463192 RepID=UPI001FB44BB1|nr:DUF1007 family protein [Pseudodesulfovibrio tunisiensis]